MDKDKNSTKEYTKVYTFIIDLKTLVKAYSNEKIKNELKINLKEQLDNINKN